MQPLHFGSAAAVIGCTMDEPDMRHPKIQALIGSNARKEIMLRLAEDLLDNPDYEPTAMDMEYWDSLHDKIVALQSKIR